MSIPQKKASRQTAATRTANMLIIAERRQEAVSGMKEDSRLVEKTGNHQPKRSQYRMEYILM